MSKAFSLDHYYDQILLKKLGSPSESALSYKLEIGRNLTLLLADLHDHGHYFIDMKPQNINVLRGSHVVTLLDCDGFSITGTDGKRFPAALVSTDYISPEAFNARAKPETLGENQDRYALAVILFQLFNKGTHPFQGIIKVPGIAANTNDEKAALGLYPHGIKPDNRIDPRLQSTFFLLDDDLRILFDRAFIEKPDNRPSAREWANCLDKLLRTKALARCEKVPNDINHIRFVGKECPACYMHDIQNVLTRKVQSQTPRPRPKAVESKPQPEQVASSTWGVTPNAQLPTSTPYESFSLGKTIGIFLAIVVLLMIVLMLGQLSSSRNVSSPKVENAQAQAPAPKAQNEGDAFTLGLEAYNQKDYIKSVELWHQAAVQGNAKAQSALGSAYQNGLGVTKDDAKAVEWFQKAAAQGEPYAQANLGAAYSNGQGVAKDDAKAFELFQKAGAQGLAYAQANLGFAYINGQGVTKDDAKAVDWFQKAAAQGNAGGQYGLGLVYKNGRGVAKDEALAVQWFQKAAAQGDADAQFRLGNANINGQGVTKDAAKAVEWWQKAAAQGHSGAQKNLGKAYFDGVGVAKDAAKALQYNRQAAEQGVPSAHVSMGWLFIVGGPNLPKDYDQAMIWSVKGAELGDGEGASNVALLYENGWGVAPDPAKAVYWYMKAISLNAYSGQAEVHLAKMYLSARGVEKNREEADRLFRRVLTDLPKASDEFKQVSKKLLSRTQR